MGMILTNFRLMVTFGEGGGEDEGMKLYLDIFVSLKGDGRRDLKQIS